MRFLFIPVKIVFVLQYVHYLAIRILKKIDCLYSSRFTVSIIDEAEDDKFFLFENLPKASIPPQTRSTIIIDLFGKSFRSAFVHDQTLKKIMTQESNKIKGVL